ncbi:hypothetical protein Tco_0888274 [Tanacetum coccineum]
MEDDVDISELTIEQYIALIPDDIKPGIVNPKIGDDIEFEINANFMRELRRKLSLHRWFIPLDEHHTHALESITSMADHSHNWYDETTTRERINDVLGITVDAIYESFKEGNSNKDMALSKKRTRKSSIADIWNPWKNPSLNFVKTQLKNRPRMMKR